MDVSAFDFLPAELPDLLVGLAPLAKAIDIEPRLHQDDETGLTAEGIVKMHEGITGPTFRVRCSLRGGDNVLAGFATLASDLGISTHLGRDGSVAVRHERAADR